MYLQVIERIAIAGFPMHLPGHRLAEEIVQAMSPKGFDVAVEN
jgi:hypothetical protein